MDPSGLKLSFIFPTAFQATLADRWHPHLVNDHVSIVSHRGISLDPDSWACRRNLSLNYFMKMRSASISAPVNPSQHLSSLSCLSKECSAFWLVGSGAVFFGGIFGVSGGVSSIWSWHQCTSPLPSSFTSQLCVGN